MFQITHAAAGQILEARRQRGLPETTGIRLSGEVRPEGMALGLAFTEIPAEDDSILEQDGLKVFVGSEMTGPLDAMALDAAETPEGPQLKLVPADGAGPV